MYSISESSSESTKGDSVKKKTFMQTMKMFFALGLCCSPLHVAAVEPQDNEECAQEILLAYFPSIFVKETLSKFKVPQEQWEAINRELSIRDKEIIKKVEAKAAKMNSNPLKDPQQRQAAVKIFRETLFENFAEVLKSNGVKDENQIQMMLDDIQQQKAKRFARCMQQQNPQQKSPSSPEEKSKESSNNPQNDADEDDDEENSQG